VYGPGVEMLAKLIFFIALLFVGITLMALGMKKR
jgi:hypothetical protein